MLKKKRGTLTYINVFECTGLVHFVDGGNEWFPASELKKGHIEDGPQPAGPQA
jgi:hypothetical protein